jgi:RHS repeat-associated protein
MTTTSTHETTARQPTRRWLQWLLAFLLLIPLASHAQVNEGLVADSIEMRVLHEFYAATGGPLWTAHTNWLQGTTLAEAATWYGVNVQQGDVVELYAMSNHLVGSLPASLGELRQLQGLYLAANELSGPLPANLANLTQLHTAQLNNNQLSGRLPYWPTYWPRIVNIDLSGNQFTGPAPAGLGLLPALNNFSAAYNQLTGLLPADVGGSTTLTGLNLSNNALQGPIPDTWGNLPSLLQLYLTNNLLSGPLPESLGELRSLNLLFLDNNQFTGTIPAGLAGLARLTVLNLDYNHFTGALPANIQAGYVLVRYNQLSGEVPSNYATRPGGLFYLEGNNFTRLPAFIPIDHPGIGMLLGNNLFAFDSFEPNQVTPGVYQYWEGQRAPAGDTLQRVAGAAVQFDGRIGGAHNHYQWQRQVGGQWLDIPGQTQFTLALTAITTAEVGTYRARVSNDWVVNLTLYSQSHFLDVTPYAPLARNRPVDANRGLVLANPPLPVDFAANRPADVNFVRVWTPRVALTSAPRIANACADSVSMSTQYLDGLGRPLQTVVRQASPQRRDLVQPQAYDGLGREPRQYLPYPDSVGGHGGYRQRALTDQQLFYRRTGPRPGAIGPPAADDPTIGVARTGAAFAETLFEASPLSRVTAQGAVGEAWQLTGGHILNRQERPNVALDSVPRFTPSYDSHMDPGYQGCYAPGELWGTEVADTHGPTEPGELGYRTIEWKDKLGRVVCKQVEANRVGTSTRARSRWLRTAYVYDDFERLRFVLQPEATKRVLPLGNQSAVLPAAAKPFLFHYRYDGRGRQIAKQVPGQDGETVVVYDQLDRSVLSQDAQQRTRREWNWTKYEALGRVVMSGLVTRQDTLGQVSLQAIASADTATAHQYEQRTADKARYPQYYTTDQSFPKLGQDGFSSGQLLTVTSYDDYDFTNDGLADAHYDTRTDSQFPSGQAPVADEGRTQGLITQTRTRVLGVAETDVRQSAWLTTTTFYDERARPIQVQSTNARQDTVSGKPYLDLLTTQLDFTGKVVQSRAVHQGPSHTPVQVAEFFTYDHTGRLRTTHQQLPTEPTPSLLSVRHYNELGQLLIDSMGTGRLAQQVKYAYNIRGWLTSLNDPFQPNKEDLFNLSLHYNKGFTTGYEQYNGNLTGQTWRGRDGVQRAYGYVYDPLNRLLQGDFVARTTTTPATPTAGAWTTELDNYLLSFVSYDDNGNINTLRRRGLLKNATHNSTKQYGAVDNLRYAYVGNRLQAVDDAVTGNQLPKPAAYHGAPASLAGDFQEQGVQLGEEYLYDANGNLTQDKNKGITGITYNHLNLPRQIHFGQVGDSVVFRYTASGQKVAKLVYQTSKTTPQRTDYLGPYQYEQDSLKFFPHAEGRVLRFVQYDPAGQATVSYQREYTLKDHLGNLRLAYRAGQVRTLTATLEQEESIHKREVQQFDSLSVSYPVAVRYAHAHSNFAAQLNAAVHSLADGSGSAGPQPLGPLAQLGVQKGDTVRVSAFGYYPQAQTRSFWFSLGSFLASLVGQQPSAPVGGDPSRGRKNLPLLQVGVAVGLPALLQNGNVPLGYLRLLVFDKDSALVSAQTQQVQLTQDANGGYEPLRISTIVGQNGYVTAYVGNESDVDVFFDDVSVEHRSGLQVQETQYDPAGLELAGLAAPSPGIRGLNNYRFNGKEFQADLGLAWNHQDWRFFDPQLLRWHSGDPELENGQESWTPYSFGYDNAVRYADANGRAPDEGGIPNALSIAYNTVIGIGVSAFNALSTISEMSLVGQTLGSPPNGGSFRGTLQSNGEVSYGIRPAATSHSEGLRNAATDVLDVLGTAALFATSGSAGAVSRSLPMGTGLLLEQGAGKVAQNEGVQTGKKLLQEVKKDDFNQARNKAMSWLEEQGFKAERPNVGRLGATKGKTTGMVGKNSSGNDAGFRVEFDERNGAHINVFSGKSKGPLDKYGKPIHYQFEASEKTVNKIQDKYGR